jgi:DNA invertase Pin-like site-specific DNA recombinase
MGIVAEENRRRLCGFPKKSGICQHQGWDFIEYTDRLSGTKVDRTAFLQMFEEAQLKKFDLVLFWALDRFSREGVLNNPQIPSEARQVRRDLEKFQ